MHEHGIDRRHFIASLSAASAITLCPFAASGRATMSLQDAASAAYTFGLPLIEMAQARAMHLAKGHRPNTLVHERTLNTPSTQDVTTPNNDTLYSTAWCDTAAGPIRIGLPNTGGRYVSIAFLDMFTNNFAIISPSALADNGGVITLAGPAAHQRSTGTVHSPTRWTLVLVRILVDGVSDLPAVHAIQDAIRLDAPTAADPPTYSPRNADWKDLLVTLQALLLENRPLHSDRAWLKNLSRLGIGTDTSFDPSRFTSDDIHAITAGLEQARASIAAANHRGEIIDGWGYPRSNLGNYAQDYPYRAKIALGGLGALPRSEAMYMRALDPNGRIFMPAGQEARLRFAPGRLPPVDGFWSATMYEYTPDGQFFLIDNPLNRYAIGDRTAGVVYEPDGALEIWMTQAPPPGGTSNWLPLPAGRPWGLVLRAYRPKPALLDGHYRLPALQFL